MVKQFILGVPVITKTLENGQFVLCAIQKGTQPFQTSYSTGIVVGVQKVFCQEALGQK